MIIYPTREYGAITLNVTCLHSKSVNQSGHGGAYWRRLRHRRAILQLT